MELILRSTEVSIPQAIENIEQLKAEIAPKMGYYSSLVVTADSIKDAKKDRAALNKLREAINEQRIAVKKQCLAPYESLEKQCRELEAMIIAPIAAIDTQIKAFEDSDKKRKLGELETYFKSLSPPEWIELADVLPQKWANKSESVESLKAQITASVLRITGDYKKLAELYSDSPNLTAIIENFERTKDMSRCAIYAATLERQYQMQKRKEEAAQAAQETPQKPPEEKPQEVQEAPQKAEEPLLTGTFTVTCTKAQLTALRDFMRAQGIQFSIGGKENGSE